MLKVKIPNNNVKEREYILYVLLNEFLGINYRVEVINGLDYTVLFELDKKIKITDAFFNKHPADLSYLKAENIPRNVAFVKNKYTSEDDIPIIFGDSDKFDSGIKIQGKEILCSIDIFASAFFMLTRWEEKVNTNRDHLNRFCAIDSYAFKNKILHRPVVNEYVEFLWGLLLETGISQKRKNRKFEIHPTHDVDIPFYWSNFTVFFRRSLGDLLKRKSLSMFLGSCKSYFFSKLQVENDPADTFDFLMDCSEKIGVKSYFYFMAEGTSKFDNFYKSNDKEIIKIVNNIKRRNHYLGIHPTFNSYNDKKQFKNELIELETNLGFKVVFGRHHILRFEVPLTWRIWDDLEMHWESTMGYHDFEGFRSGVCFDYSVFDICFREMLKVKERPLIVMEETLIKTRNKSKEEFVSINLKYAIKVKEYNGNFVFLFHNDSFEKLGWGDYKSTYMKLLVNLKELYED